MGPLKFTQVILHYPLRDYIPKGESIEKYTDEEILSFADALNNRPRRVLGYHTPEDLFDTFLDKIYAC